MGYNDNGLTPADFGAILRGNNGGNGWGMNGIGDLIALIIVGGLFGNGGFGGGFGGNNILPWLLMGGFNGGGLGGAGLVAGNNVLSSDFAQIDRKLDGLANGICDATFSLNNTISNGFAAAQNTMTQGFAGLNTGMITQGYETRLGIQGIGSQMAQCCCDLKDGIAGVNYNIANQAAGINNTIGTGLCGLSREVERGFCDTQYRDAMNTNALLQSGHADTDRIISKLDMMENTRKDERIAQLTQENLLYQYRNDNQAQTTQLLRELGYHCPQPAYVVQPPQQVTFPTSCCGQFNINGGCGYNGGTWAA